MFTERCRASAEADAINVAFFDKQPPHSAAAMTSVRKYETRTKRAGITFPVGRVHRFLRKTKRTQRISSDAAVYLASVLEYVVAEIVELAGHTAKDEKRKRITPRHVMYVVIFSFAAVN